MKKTWEGIHAPVEYNKVRATTTSHFKRNEYKMMSMINIIIFSFIIGGVLTKEIGGTLKENSLLKENSRWQPSNVRNKDEMNEKAIEDMLITAYNCLDNSLPSTRISLNLPKEFNIEDGSAYNAPTEKRAQILEHVRLDSKLPAAPAYVDP